MTDAQVLTIAIAVIVPLSLLLYSNSRITDTNARITDMKETIRADMRALQAIIQQELISMRGDINAAKTEANAGFERLDNKLKIHELEHHQ